MPSWKNKKRTHENLRQCLASAFSLIGDGVLVLTYPLEAFRLRPTLFHAHLLGHDIFTMHGGYTRLTFFRFEENCCRLLRLRFALKLPPAQIVIERNQRCSEMRQFVWGLYSHSITIKTYHIHCPRPGAPQIRVHWIFTEYPQVPTIPQT